MHNLRITYIQVFACLPEESSDPWYDVYAQSKKKERKQSLINRRTMSRTQTLVG